MSICLGSFISYFDFKNGIFDGTGYFQSESDYPENVNIHYYGVSAGPEVKLHVGCEYAFITLNFYSLIHRVFVPVLAYCVNKKNYKCGTCLQAMSKSKRRSRILQITRHLHLYPPGFCGNAQAMDDLGFFALMASKIEFCGKLISSRLSYIIHDFV